MAVVLVLFTGFTTSLSYAQTKVVNGDFEAGNSGFTSDYTYQPDLPGRAEMYPEGLYSVGYNPYDYHDMWYSTGDHTTGTGQMFIANGDANTSKTVWQGTTSVPLVVGQTYNFSAWVMDVDGGAHSSLTFKADGVTITTLTCPNYHTWNRVYGTFFAGSANPTLTLTNAQGAAAGNDFVVDDINVLITTTTTLTSSPDPSSFGQTVTLTATVSPSGATGTVTFKEGGTTLGSAPVVGGVATLDISTLGVGTHNLTAEYGGDADYDPSSGGDSHEVLNLPEIDVQRPAGTSIADGGADNVGDRLAGTVTLDYTICNVQSLTLTIPSGGVTAANLVNCSGFTVLTALPLNIDGGNCATLQISLNVTDHGPFSFDMDIANNDDNENPYDIAVSGMGLAPEIDVQRPAGTSIADGGADNIGHKLIGTINLTYTIDNTAGTEKLHITTVTGSDYANSSGLVATFIPSPHVHIGGKDVLQISFTAIAPGPFSLIMHIVNDDVNENPYDITITGTAWPPPEAIFYATPTMGCPGSRIRFENQSEGMTNAWWWDFGDGRTSTDKDPSIVYPYPGQYTISLISANPAAADTLVNLEMIWIYGYGHIRWSPLALVDNSFAFPDESWDNAIDGDISGWIGTATVEGTPPFVDHGNPPFAIFEFLDKTTKPINAVRLLTDTDVGFGDRWVTSFHVMVSTTGVADDNFVTVLNGSKIGGDWQEFTFTEVLAKYIKLVIDNPNSGWRQIGEFQVCPAYKAVDPKRSSMVATSPHLANGIDQSTITITLRDKDGELITGRTDPDFCIWADPEPNIYYPVIETESPGVYTTQLASLHGGEKQFGACVNGVPLGTIPIFFNQPDLTKASLQLVASCETFQNEGWANAIDGDTDGWDGTVTAGGSQCYAVFQFADGAIKAVQKLRLLVDTNVGHEMRWAKRFRVLVSTTGLNDADFVVIHDGLQTTGGWQEHVFRAANAKYVKLVVDFPASGWRQVGEIELFASAALTFENNTPLAEDLTTAPEVPDKFSVGGNYPNPFNPETKVDFALPEASYVVAAIYNTLGQKVRTLLDAPMVAGYHTVAWNGANDAGQPLPSGIYFFRLQAGSNSYIQKMLMTK